MTSPLYMPGDLVRLPNGRLAKVELARQSDPPRPLDIVELYFDEPSGSPWPTFERWHPSWIVPICAACAEETERVRRFDDELLCHPCFTEAMTRS